MKETARIISPEDYLLSILSPKDRFEAAFRVVGEAFKKSKVNCQGRRERSQGGQERHTKKRNRTVIDTSVIVSAFAFGGIPENGGMGRPSRNRDIAVAEAGA